MWQTFIMPLNSGRVLRPAAIGRQSPGISAPRFATDKVTQIINPTFALVLPGMFEAAGRIISIPPLCKQKYSDSVHKSNHAPPFPLSHHLARPSGYQVVRKE